MNMALELKSKRNEPEGIMVKKIGLGIVLLQCVLVFSTDCFAIEKEYRLNIERNTVNFTGKSISAMTVNGSIPGPVLEFQEGDMARIHVTNSMDVETSIHWHGLLVPPNMDGVPYLTYPPIKPGTTFTYEFPIRQSGTYWYHSHTGLQEQRGVYGAVVIKPNNEPTYTHDQVILLSDWTDEDPHHVLRTLKRGSEWYSIEKGSAQSLIGSMRKKSLGSYLSRELQRMPAMDIADVAYDRFLANGQSESFVEAQAGETLRLRVINGSASTFFYVEFAGGPMTLITADGQPVEPLEKKRLLISVAETYDVLVTVPESGQFEFRATAQDGSAYSRVWVGSGEKVYAESVPYPDLYHGMGNVGIKQIFAITPASSMGMSHADVKAGKFDEPGMMEMGGMDMSSMDMSGMDMSAMSHAHHTMDHSMEHSMPSPGDVSERFDGKSLRQSFKPLSADVASIDNLAMDGMPDSRPWPPYAELRSPVPTHFNADKPVREVRLTLDGDMERYVWFLNNKALEESDDIAIKAGEVVRFIMINRTMMHHPMHLHGHFFRVLNEQGDYSPLKHTVDVTPMSTTVIEFDAGEVGDWFFHCHLLYHMMSGMARVVHYEDFQPDAAVSAIRSQLNHNAWYGFIEADLLSNMTQGTVSLSNYRQLIDLSWEFGWQNVEDTEWEGLLTWGYYVNRFFVPFVGVDVLGEADRESDTRGIMGFRYLLPLNLESSIWIDSEGGGRLSMGRELHLTPRLLGMAEVEYDTHTDLEWKAGMAYLITKDLSAKVQWHSDFELGGGLELRY